MSKSVRIRYKRGWIAYPGSIIQQNYAEDLQHGYLLWDIQDKSHFDVAFRVLPNPKPYVTIEWLGTLDATLKECIKSLSRGARVRVRTCELISHQDVLALTGILTEQFSVSEVTFKNDIEKQTLEYNVNGASFVKEDLRNAGVLLNLVKNFYTRLKISDDEWRLIEHQLDAYLKQLTVESSLRNVKWVLRHMQFDNTFSYGKGNVINFDSLNGIVGILGPNRIGKSSIPGTMMYALFNATDRGSIKNQHVCNVLASECNAKAVINVNGIDYVIERETRKYENRRGEINAPTSLGLYRIDENEEVVDLVAEGRMDTEKVLRNLIGTSSDFLMTTFAAQGEMNTFINHGSARRWAILSKFLDFDVFKQINDLAKVDANVTKMLLGKIPDRNWEKVSETFKSKIELTSKNMLVLDRDIVALRDRVNNIRVQLSKFGDVSFVVTQSQVDQQQKIVCDLELQAASAVKSLSTFQIELKETLEKIKKIEKVKNDYDANDLRERVETCRKLKSSLVSLEHSYDSENLLLKQQVKSLKMLETVPCGDAYPTCRFIKDAHECKLMIDKQEARVETAKKKVQDAQETLEGLLKGEWFDKLQKVEKLSELLSRLFKVVADSKLKVAKLKISVKTIEDELVRARHTLESLEHARVNEENVEIVMLRNELDRLEREIDEKDKRRVELAAELGGLQREFESFENERQQRAEIFTKLTMQERITHAFANKGIPSLIITSQLPLINAEISKILTGVVDFTIELERIVDGDDIEIYINYGNNRRIIELCSGMEKMIASIALRVALINVSTLPKTDMFIIDEGFGALDDLNIEACNRLLMALKKYFRLIIVMTHVDSIKDVVDCVLEIHKDEKHSKVVFK